MMKIFQKQKHQKYDIVLKTMNCSLLENLGKTKKCEIGTQQGKTGVIYDATVVTDISSIILQALFYTEIKGGWKLWADVKDMDLCRLLTESSGFSRIALMFKEILAAKGDLPEKCPILQGTRVAFNMLNVDPNSFPFLPEMTFKLVLLYNVNDFPNGFNINVTGQVANRRRLGRIKFEA